MTPPLFLRTPLPSAGEFVLDGDEGRHAARVQRLRVGETVWVSDGLGGLLDCVVAAVVADGLRLHVRSASTAPLPDPWLVVVQALPKGDRGELAVEVLTELGADEIVPWAAERCVTRWEGPRGEKSLEKWRRTAREAAKQSRRTRLPAVTSPATLPGLLARAPWTLVLHEGAAVPFATVRLPVATVDPVGPVGPVDAVDGVGSVGPVAGSGRRELVLVVGPEGGVSDDELARLTAAGATAVRLGEPVLRTSTAGAAALAVLATRLGRWN